MSQIRIIHQQQQQLQSSAVIPAQTTDQFVENLRVGQTLSAKLVLIENKHWLVVEGTKIFIPKETLEQWNLQENKPIKLKVRSLAAPVELQIINKPVNREQVTLLKSEIPTDALQSTKKVTSDVVQTTSKASGTNEAILKPEQPTTDNKIKISNVDAEKIILEARKYLNKSVPAQNSSGVDNKTVMIKAENDGLSSIIHKKLIQPESAQINIHREFSKASTTAIPTARVTTPTTPTTNSTSAPQLPSTAATSTLTTTQPTGITNEKVVNSNVANSSVSTTELPLNKLSLNMQKALNNHQTSGLVDAEIKQPPSTEQQKIKSLINNTPDPVNKTINTDKLINPNIQIKTNQQSLFNNTALTSTKAQQLSGQVAKPDSTSIIQNTQSSQQKAGKSLKFEIPVILPDKERFPMLSEKITTAFDRHLQQQQPTKKQFNELFAQLQRLNQWSTGNKTSRRSETGSQSEKLASDLKESLKDLFRYINQKDGLKSAKNIEKALRQSGAFLENRISRQEAAEKKLSTGSSAELTLHKDLKANLNRVLATALYNLAKINNPQTTSTNTTRAETLANTTTGADQKLTTAQKQVMESALTDKSNLLQNLRSRLMKISQGQSTTPTNLPELEAITRRVLKHANSVLSQTQMSQLTNLRPDTSAQQWLFELPVMNKEHLDVFTLFLKQHTAKENEKSKQGDWSLVLQFELGHLGKIRAMLSWNTKKVEVKFIAEQSETVSMVHNELKQFQNKLQEQGIAFEQLTVEQAQLDDLTIQFSKGDAND